MSGLGFLQLFDEKGCWEQSFKEFCRQACFLQQLIK